MMRPMRNDPLFRPPAEAESLILQVDQGCPYNRCTFCGMYRGVPFERRALAALRPLLAREARRAPETRRIFLADGDALRRPFAELQALLVELAALFPQLARVNLYATGHHCRHARGRLEHGKEDKTDDHDRGRRNQQSFIHGLFGRLARAGSCIVVDRKSLDLIR